MHKASGPTLVTCTCIAVTRLKRLELLLVLHTRCIVISLAVISGQFISEQPSEFRNMFQYLAPRLPSTRLDERKYCRFLLRPPGSPSRYCCLAVQHIMCSLKIYVTLHDTCTSRKSLLPREHVMQGILARNKIWPFKYRAMCRRRSLSVLLATIGHNCRNKNGYNCSPSKRSSTIFSCNLYS